MLLLPAALQTNVSPAANVT
uniref:Uncharacterized protein n=1 Tax=Anguilla anguilla TaxID=7936 RepID=A0A0E9T9V6_ANGAN